MDSTTPLVSPLRTALMRGVVEPMLSAVVLMALLPLPIGIVLAGSLYLPQGLVGQLILIFLLGMMTCLVFGAVVSMELKERELNPFIAFPSLVLFIGSIAAPILGLWLGSSWRYEMFSNSFRITCGCFLIFVVISFEWLLFALHYKVIGKRLVD